MSTFKLGDKVGFWVHAFEGIITKIEEYRGNNLYHIEVKRENTTPIVFVVPANNIYLKKETPMKYKVMRKATIRGKEVELYWYSNNDNPYIGSWNKMKASLFDLNTAYNIAQRFNGSIVPV